jgi:DNA-binding MarR family transcriptional regulator
MSEEVDAVVQLSFAVQEILSSIAAEYDVSMTQVRMLGILRDREPAMLELARVLALEKSSVTGLVDRAEQRGFVARTRGATDGRAVHVKLTPAGQEVTARFAGQVAERIAELLAPLNARERAQLARLAARVAG